jgi:hypothetical protein
VSIRETCEWLQSLDFPREIRESTWLFPTIETVHVLALVLVVGSISMIDLRLLGFANRERSVADLTAEALPWTWSAFAVAAIAGLLMFSSKAATYYENLPFRLKMICMAIAGLNMVVFHAVIARKQSDWDFGRPPTHVKLVGGVSLAMWIAIVAAGRWVGFTTV